jgi:fibronectin-binding autotransporter adhesin
MNMKNPKTTKNSPLRTISALGQLLLLTAVLAAPPGIHAQQSGVWTNNNDGGVAGVATGSWATATNWNNSLIASGAGYTADFSTLSLTAISTNTLNAAWTIGNLIFANNTPGAPAANTNWVVNASLTNATLPAANSLTLSVSSGSPVINVSNQITVINAGLFGTGGFIKAGAGTLRLNGANSNATQSLGLGGQILVTNGDLQAGSVTAFGQAGIVSGGTTVYCTNGGSVEVISGIAVNDYQLFLGGTGDGNIGALYSNPANTGGSDNTTRWGLSISNATSSITDPAVILVTNAAIQVDGVATYTNTPLGLSASNNLLVGFITCMTPNGIPTTGNVTNGYFTVTKTGLGNLELEEGLLCSNVDIKAGSVFPDSANHFNGINLWTVESGAALLNNQNETFNAPTITLQINSGGLYDANFRADSTAYTQSLGALTGAGTFTSGERGNTGAQSVTISGTNSAIAGNSTYNLFGSAITNNSLFSGTIATASGTLNLAKTGGTNTTVTLTGHNTYNGTTTVSAGGWMVDGSHSSAGGTYTVNTGAILGGNGTISPSINLNSGTLMAGDPNGYGTGSNLTVNTVASSTGSGDETIVSNANLYVNGSLGTAGTYLSTLYLTNGTLTLLLPGSTTANANAFVMTLQNDGNVKLAYTDPNPQVGQFHYISYGSITGLAGGGTNGFTLVNPPGLNATLVNNTGNSSLDINITSIPALAWNGTAGGTWANSGGGNNWLNGSTPAAYVDGDYVQFTDSLKGTTNVDLTTTVTPTSITVNNSLSNYLFSGTGAIAGSTTGLLKEGTANLTIANTTNTFGGATSITAGQVIVGNGGTTGCLGASQVNIGANGTLTFNLSGNNTVTNTIGGSGILSNLLGTVTLTGVISNNNVIGINLGSTMTFYQLPPCVLSNTVTGGGQLGVSGQNGEALILENTANDWTGGTLIYPGGTLQVGDANSPGSLPGNVTDNGILSLNYQGSGVSANNISGTGEVLVPSYASVTLAGVNSYSGQTVVLGGSVTAAAASYSTNSTLTLGDQTGGSGLIGTANFTAGNPVIGGLNAGGNTTSPNTLNFEASGQVLTINGNVSVGATTPAGAAVLLQATGTDASVVINTNGGTIQLGLGDTSTGVNPDKAGLDFSQINNLVVNLGATGVINLGTLDGNPGPPAGATVVNQLFLAAVSNSITAGTLTIGAGGRQLDPQLLLGPGTNILDVGTLNVGTGGRDGGDLLFNNAPSTGGVTIRGVAGGATRAEYNQGVNATTATAAGFATTVDFSGGTADLLFDSMVIGNEPVRAASSSSAFGWANTFSFGQGTLNANSVSLSKGCLSSATGSSTMNIGGGMASLGAVSLTASVASGTLNIYGNATVTVSNITYTGSGTATLSLDYATLNVSLGAPGNPAVAPVAVGSLIANDTVNLGVNGTNFTVGEFPLISYTGTIGGNGYSSLNLTSLPAGVSGYLTNNLSNPSVDVVITGVPVTVSTNAATLAFKASVVSNGSGGQNLVFTWDSGHTGWILQAETNAPGGINSNYWVNVAGSTNVNTVTIPIVSTDADVFYRMLYVNP